MAQADTLLDRCLVSKAESVSVTVPFCAQFSSAPEHKPVMWKLCCLSELSVVPVAAVNTAKNSVPKSILHWSKLLKNIANRC